MEIHLCNYILVTSSVVQNNHSTEEKKKKGNKLNDFQHNYKFL